MWNRHQRPTTARLAAAMLVAVLGGVPTGGATAQDTAASHPPISYEESSRQVAVQSDALAGATASVAAARDQAAALKALRLPRISLDVQGLRYQKSLRASLGDLKEQAESSASGVLDGIASAGVPGVPDSVVDQVIGEVQSSLPDLFAPIPDSISLQSRRTLLHATVSAVAPIYTGGAITASQETARIGVRMAEAQLQNVNSDVQFALVRAYFGQVLAAQVRQVAQDTRDGFEEHLGNARKLEKHGQLSHGRVLQVVVARDSSQRALDAAEGDWQTAAQTLANLLRSPTWLAPTSPLFVNSRPLPEVTYFLDAARNGQPRLRQAETATEIAEQAVKLAHAKRLPSVFAFGSYNLNRRHALLPEPDWMVGVGMHYTLWPQASRRQSESAAQARQAAAEAASREAWSKIQTAVHKSYNLVETARRQFLSLESSIIAATESLRVAELSFREGMATATELIDARNLLAQAHTERATVAYKYDLALASLLLASGQTEQFGDHMYRADHTLSMP